MGVDGGLEQGKGGGVDWIHEVNFWKLGTHDAASVCHLDF